MAAALPWHCWHEKGRATCEQFVVIRAVRVVTVQAIVPDGRVLPEERAAFLRMAIVAKFIDRIGLQQRPYDVEPWGLWQSTHEICPPGSGMWERFANSARCC